MDFTRWNLNINYDNKNINLIGDHAYDFKSNFPAKIKFLLKVIQKYIEEIEERKINFMDYKLDIKLKNNIYKSKINNLITKIESINNKFKEKSSNLKEELKASNYKSVSILSYTWLSGWSNTGGPYKNVEAEVNELCRNLFGYEIDEIIKINNKEINLKENRHDLNKAEKIRDDVLEFHENKLKN